jgi:hypothetical protein
MMYRRAASSCSGARRPQLQIVSQQIVLKLDRPSPRVQLLSGKVIERQLQALVHLVAREDDSVALVVADPDGSVADAIDPIDGADDLEAANGDLERLLHGEHLVGLDEALGTAEGLEDLHALAVSPESVQAACQKSNACWVESGPPA